VPAAPKPYRVPKTLGACADALYLTRQERLLDQRDIAALAARETALKEHIIATLPKSDSSGVAGKVARVQVVVDRVPRVDDWDALLEHVRKKRMFHLLQRRLNDAAVEEIWAEGGTVPGVSVFGVVKVSVNKL